MLDAGIPVRHAWQIVQPNNCLMSNLTGSRLCSIALLAFSCNFCFAQPSGQFSIDFDTSTPLIDMTGTFQVSDQIIGAGGQPIALNYGVGITHSTSGALRGNGTALVQIGDSDFLAARYRASGRVSGGGNNPIRVFLSVHLTGEGQIAGSVETRFSISVAYNLTFNPEEGDLEGSSRGSAAFSNLASGRVRSIDSISVGLPGGGDGSWEANMNIVPFKQLVGSAQVVLSGGRTVNARLTGHFDAGSGISVVRFAGTNVDRGSSAIFSLSTTDAGTEVETVHGKILGQRILF
jgi:hypothetical protein